MAQHEFYKSMDGTAGSGKRAYRHTDAAIGTDFPPVLETGLRIKRPALDPAGHLFFSFYRDRF